MEIVIKKGERVIMKVNKKGSSYEIVRLEMR
jgi:hypothetical protein